MKFAKILFTASVLLMGSSVMAEIAKPANQVQKPAANVAKTMIDQQNQATKAVISPAPKKTVANTATPAFTGKVNLNTATAKELQQLNGIGASKAKAIINYRKKIGGFKTVEQLKDVKGIGEELFNKNKANLAL